MSTLHRRLGVVLAACCGAASAAGYPHLEATFDLPGLAGNPFDYRENDIRVVITDPAGGEVIVPAFFDGGTTWRVRHTPSRPGRHTFGAVTRNGTPVPEVKLAPVNVADQPGPGFVRLDPGNPLRFADDAGQPYYPLGHNIGWGTREHDVPWFLERLGQAGGNWARIWMCAWGGTTLDWVPGWSSMKKIQPGELSLETAQNWDRIVRTAEAGGIRFQMTLQHHGQYSTHTDANWQENPWNEKNGGWLPDAEAFFTDSRAVALTKLRYRYIIARWGSSPSILAWELYNEVQYVDAEANGHPEKVTAWHRDMAAFLREQDPYDHLITTSSDLNLPGIWDVVDYYQPHAYPSDLLPVVAGLDEQGLKKPYFLGEMGPGQGLDRDDGRFLHRALWGSLMSESAGAAQYWAWDTVARNDLYPHFRAASAFVQASGLAGHGAWRRLTVGVSTAQGGPLRFAPGQGWAEAKQTEFTVEPSGGVAGLGGMPSFLHGEYHKGMFPRAVFHVTCPADGTFAVRLGQIAHSGARVQISVDGTKLAEQEFAATAQDQPSNAVLLAPVPAGEHTVAVENTGQDWVVVAAYELTPYAPALEVVAKGGADGAAAWVASRLAGEAVKGTLTLPGLAAGEYRVTWWDTATGQRSGQATATAGADGLKLETPAIAGDAAVTVARL